MPLVRYEVRCEHSLANPELYRSAARDDPEGLLEGVAMAGLVGIVRQLGDLAEFAAEIFRDLHEELMAIGGRAHDLSVRVQQLEAELPSVEKALLSEPNQLRFAYTNGADWHASIRSDQNHCTSGDLPRFVRNFYEECRGPPRLFLLDKFDGAGAGACLKRYTDPSFFKLEWASSELMKAQRAQRDKKARREKKKGRRRRTGQPIAAIHQIPARVRYGSASLEDLDGLPQALASTLKVEVPALSHLGVNHGAGMQIRKSSASGSNVMLAEDTSLPALKPIRVSGLQNGEGLSQASKPLKLSAKDIESTNIPGKFYKHSEPEGSMAGRISKIIEMEDRDAIPSAGRGPMAVDNKGFKAANGSTAPPYNVNVEVAPAETKAVNGVSREDLEAAAIARAGLTSRGTSRGDSSMDVWEGAKQLGNGKISHGSMPDLTEPAIMQAEASRKSSNDVSDPAQVLGEFSQRSSLEGREASPRAGRFSRQISIARSSAGGRFSRQVSMARSGSDVDDFVDAPSTMDSEGDSDFEAQSGPIGDVYRVSELDEDAKLNHTALKEHVEAQKHYNPPGVEQPHSLPTFLAQVTELAARSANEQQIHEDFTEAPPLGHASPVSAILNDGPPSSSASSGKSAGDVHVSVQESEVQRANIREGDSGEAFQVSQGTAESRIHIQTARVVEIPEHGEESQMLSLMATSPAVSSLGSISSATSPAMATPGQEFLQPSISMLSGRSYSSELMSVSSDSEPESPISPKSPAFNALYSPPGSPSRTSRDMIDSPPGMYGGTYSPSVHHSDHSSPSRTEIPILSLSPTSPSTSPSSAPLADWEDQAGPVHPAPCPPLIVIPVESESVSLPSRPRPQLYRLPSPPVSPLPELSTSPKLDDGNLPPSGGFSGPTSPQADAESTHAESADLPDLQHSPTSRPDVEIPYAEPASLTEMRRSPGALSEADFPSRSTTPTPPFTELVRSSLLLPPRPVDSPGSSAPTSPVGSLQQDFQRIFLSSPSVQAAPSPLGNAVDYSPPSPSGRDEESAPSSPSGSVIIKDTPSPPASPASNASESESEGHDFYGQVSHAVQDGVIAQQKFSGEITLPESPRSKSPPSVPTSPVDGPQSLSTSGSTSTAASEQPETLPEISSKGSVSNALMEDKNTQEKTSPLPSPPMSPQLDLHPASSPEITDSTTLRPVSSVRSNSRSQTSLAAISQPHSPPQEQEPAGSSNLQWRGRLKPNSPPKTEFKLPPASPLRSTTNSPPNSPPKSLWSEASSLKWHGRSDPHSPPKPDFSLPPNLVCRSESSSPPCSPPPQSDTESPKLWAAMSGDAGHSDSSGSPPESPHKGAADMGVYDLPESPLPPDSPTMSEEGERSPVPPTSRHGFEDEYGDEAEHHEPEMVPFATARLGLEDSERSPVPIVPILRHDFEEENGDEPEHHEPESVPISTVRSGSRLPSSSSDKSFGVLFPMPAKPEENHVPSAATESESSLSPIEGSVTQLSLPTPVVTDARPEAEDSQQPVPVIEMDASPVAEADEPPTPPPVPGFELRKTPDTKDSLAAAIAQHDRNMLKVLTFQEPVIRPLPPPDGRTVLLEQIRTKSFNLRRTDSMEKKEAAPRPVANINVAAILEKAKAIRQAFVGRDDEDGDEDDWSDS